MRKRNRKKFFIQNINWKLYERTFELKVVQWLCKNTSKRTSLFAYLFLQYENQNQIQQKRKFQKEKLTTEMEDEWVRNRGNGIEKSKHICIRSLEEGVFQAFKKNIKRKTERIQHGSFDLSLSSNKPNMIWKCSGTGVGTSKNMYEIVVIVPQKVLRSVVSCSSNT